MANRAAPKCFFVRDPCLQRVVNGRYNRSAIGQEQPFIVRQVLLQSEQAVGVKLGAKPKDHRTLSITTSFPFLQSFLNRDATTSDMLQ
jgi:hypothetical protein